MATKFIVYTNECSEESRSLIYGALCNLAGEFLDDGSSFRSFAVDGEPFHHSGELKDGVSIESAKEAILTELRKLVGLSIDSLLLKNEQTKLFDRTSLRDVCVGLPPKVQHGPLTEEDQVIADHDIELGKMIAEIDDDMDRIDKIMAKEKLAKRLAGMRTGFEATLDAEGDVDSVSEIPWAMPDPVPDYQTWWEFEWPSDSVFELHNRVIDFRDSIEKANDMLCDGLPYLKKRSAMARGWTRELTTEEIAEFLDPRANAIYTWKKIEAGWYRTGVATEGQEVPRGGSLLSHADMARLSRLNKPQAPDATPEIDESDPRAVIEQIHAEWYRTGVAEQGQEVPCDHRLLTNKNMADLKALLQAEGSYESFLAELGIPQLTDEALFYASAADPSTPTPRANPEDRMTYGDIANFKPPAPEED